MTHLIETLTAIVLSGSILAGLVRTVAMLTRIADSVDRLSESVEKVGEQIGDHERRISRLEDSPTPAAVRPRRARAGTGTAP